jgi:YegS/Rv2252/BmrU family lipid kinase
MHKTLVIINSKAAQGRTGRLQSEIRQRFPGGTEFVETSEGGHAERLAFDAASGDYGTIVAAGGDGTIHEIANGILLSENQHIRLGLLPLGSGNDYAAACGIPGNWQHALEFLQSGESSRVDVGEVCDANGRRQFFVNTLGLGLSGEIALEARSIRRFRGVMKYGLATLIAVARHRRILNTVMMVDDFSDSFRTMCLFVALGHREGGGFVVAPRAKIDDGWFDCLHVSDLSVVSILRYLPGLIRGVIPVHPGIRSFRCRTMTLESDAPLVVHLDGEPFIRREDEQYRISVRLIPHALSVYCRLPVWLKKGVRNE